MERMRWRYGDCNPVMADVAAETVVEIGDLLCYPYGMGCVVPAAAVDVPDVACPTTRLSAIRHLFVSRFLGVAMQRSREGSTEPIRVATSGVFEFPCAGASVKDLGQLVGVDRDQHTIRLCSQRIHLVESPGSAIARIVRQTDAADVLVELHSWLMRGPLR